MSDNISVTSHIGSEFPSFLSIPSNTCTITIPLLHIFVNPNDSSSGFRNCLAYVATSLCEDSLNLSLPIPYPTKCWCYLVINHALPVAKVLPNTSTINAPDLESIQKVSLPAQPLLLSTEKRFFLGFSGPQPSLSLSLISEVKDSCRWFDEGVL